MKSSSGNGRQTRTAKIVRLDADGERTTRHDTLAVEEPLEIRVRGRSVAVTMRTPGHDRELAAGFLLTERIISERKQLIDIATCRASLEPQNTLDVFLRFGVEVDFARLTRHVFATSSCGLCGKASIESVQQHFPPVNSTVIISATTILQLPARMKRAQRAFAKTGGLHAAAIFDARGKLIVLREDVGRHNAVDKVCGWLLAQGRRPVGEGLLWVSGRAGAELVLKAARAGIPAMAAVGAPSSLAVELAESAGMTLVGFLREGRMNVYAGEERLAG
jgi:FdhD protein